MASTHREENVDPNHDGLIIGVVSVFSVLSFGALVMRLVSKRIKRAAWDYDDFLAIVSWIITLAQSTTVVYVTRFGGLGRHAYLISTAKLTAFLKAYYALSFFQTTALATAKLSVLYLLHRIFITRRFRITVQILASIVVLWCISFTFAFAFICSPIRVNWEPATPHRCGDRQMVLLLGPLPWILTDFAILTAPLFVIKNLQLRGSDKIGLYAFFLTGGLTCIVACYRYKTLFETVKDETWDTVNVGLWSIIETNVTVFCVCLITTRPVFEYLFPATLLRKARLGWSRLRFSSLRGSSQNGMPTSRGPFGSSTDLHNDLPPAATLKVESSQSIPLGNFKPIPRSGSFACPV